MNGMELMKQQSSSSSSSNASSSPSTEKRPLNQTMSAFQEEPGEGVLRARNAGAYSDHNDKIETASSMSVSSSSSIGVMMTTAPPFRTIDEYLQAAADETAASPRRSRYPWQYWFIFLSLGVANSSDATEVLCLSYILADERFKQDMLLQPEQSSSSSSGGNLAAAVFFGMLIGGLWVGTAGDIYGRRPVLLMGCAMNAVAGTVAAASTHLTVLTTCRLVAGLGIGATVPPLFTLCTELAPPSQRGLWVAVVASFWMVGSIYVAVVGWFLFSTFNDDDNDDSSSSGNSSSLPPWRLFLLACALPSVLGGLLVATNVPESPRFLALQGKHARAAQVAQNLGTKLLATSRPWTLVEAQEQFPPQRQVQQHHHNANSKAYWKDSLVELYYATKVLYGAELYSTMIGLQIVWGSLSFGSYGLSTWINSLFEQVHLQNIYFNALLFALSNLPGNIFTAFYLDSFGRQATLTASLLAASGSLAVFAYAAASGNVNDDGTNHHAVLIVVAACSFQAFTIAAWNTVDVVTAEVFPTSVRSTAVGLCAATGRLAAMLAQIVNGALISHPGRLLATSAVSLALGAVVPRCMIPDRTGMVVLDQLHEGEVQVVDLTV